MDETFATLAKGKDFITFSDLKEWPLIKEMEAVGDIDDKQLKEILKTAGKSFSLSIFIFFLSTFIFLFFLSTFFKLFSSFLLFTVKFSEVQHFL